MDRFAARRDQLRRRLRKEEIPALLVTRFTNVTYLTGFTGDDSWLLVTPQGELLLSDFRYGTQLAEECPGLTVEMRPTGTSLGELTAALLPKLRISTLGVEGQSMSVATHAQLVEKAPAVALKATDGLVEELRAVKDAEEIAEIRLAVQQAERAFAVLRASLSPDQTERQLAHLLEHQIRQFGGAGCSFQPIVAVGDRAALPHYRASERRIGEAPFVLVDWGAQARLYKSDLTRVLVTARIPPKLEKLYGVVLKAQAAGIAAIRPGAIPEDVDAAARKVIADAGYGKQFGHGLGHGIGLDIHEQPRLAVKQKQPLKPGMVITVEPGIYVPGFGGVRIEDDVLVTRSGNEVLSRVPKEFDEIAVA
jgi:Xaa-Pro aminopeptidase